MKLTPLLLAATVGLCHADLYVSNFTAINGTSGASGMWRNHTTLTDLPAFPITLTQVGGTVQPADGSSSSSIINPDGGQIYNLWEDVPMVPPFPPFTDGSDGIDVFEPNFVGDYINIQTIEGNTTTVTLDLGANITDPIISLTDVEFRTTITFPASLSELAGTSNLDVSGTTLSSDGTMADGDFTPDGVFEREAAGSVQLTGTFSTIIFTVFVAVDNTDPEIGIDDKTGYVVATESEPQPLTSSGPPVLTISRSGDDVTLTWDIGAFDSIQMSGAGAGLSGWMAVPSLDPGAVGMWTGSIASLGEGRYFRGVYTP